MVSDFRYSHQGVNICHIFFYLRLYLPCAFVSWLIRLDTRLFPFCYSKCEIFLSLLLRAGAGKSVSVAVLPFITSRRNTHTHILMRTVMVFLTLVLLAVSVEKGGAVGQAAPCLEYLACYDEDYLDYSHMQILHYDVFHRTASSCLPLCLEARPTSLVVMAKMVELNERLVCGCGENQALGNGTGSVRDWFGCDRCPEGEEKREKCGGQMTISVYRVEHSGECRAGLHPGPPISTPPTTPTTTTTTLTTTTQDSDQTQQGTKTTSKLKFLGCIKAASVRQHVLWSFLSRTRHEADQCFATCAATRPRKYIFLRIAGNNIFCGCG